MTTSTTGSTPDSASPAAGSSAGPQAPGKMVAGGKRPRKQRQAISCTECRQRKLKCDRKVPGCSACIKRKLPLDRCKFGDERDFESKEERETRLAKMAAASQKRARKRAAAAAAKKAAAAAAAAAAAGGLPLPESTAGQPPAAGRPSSSKHHGSEGSDSSSDELDSGEDDDDSEGDQADPNESSEPPRKRLESTQGVPSVTALAGRARSGSSISSTHSHMDSPLLRATGNSALMPSYNGGSPALSGALPPASVAALTSIAGGPQDLDALRSAAEAAVAAQVQSQTGPAGGINGSAVSLPGTPGAVAAGSAATASAIAAATSAFPALSAAQHAQIAAQARSNAFAAHAQVQAQQIAKSSSAHSIAALVAAMSSAASSPLAGAAPGTSVTPTPAQSGPASPAANGPPSNARSNIGASTSSLRRTMSEDVTLIPEPDLIHSPGMSAATALRRALSPHRLRNSIASPSSPSASGEPIRSPSAGAVSGVQAVHRKGFASAASSANHSRTHSRSHPEETDDLMDTLSSTDTTNAALGLQRLYESAETLSMLAGGRRDPAGAKQEAPASQTTGDGRARLGAAAESKNGGTNSEGQAQEDRSGAEPASRSSLSVPHINIKHETAEDRLGGSSFVAGAGKHRAMSPPTAEEERRGRTLGAAGDARQSRTAPLSSPHRPSQQSASLAAISAELIRHDNMVKTYAKSRAVSLLPGKHQTIHLMQLYLDELGVVIPFVRPDFVMKELDLLYDSIEMKSSHKSASVNGSSAPPDQGPSRAADIEAHAEPQTEEPQQTAAAVVNPVVGTGPGAGLPHPRLTFLAYVLFALGSIAELLPSTYLISYGITRSSDQVSQMLHDWQEAAIACINAAELAANPSLEGVQATLVAVIALAHRFRHKDLLRLLDGAIRAARRLGLDRLGSADASIAPGPSIDLQIDPAKRTLQHWWIDPEVSMSSANLEIGRAVWSGILIADWNHCGLNGSYNVNPHSYTSRPPVAPALPEFIRVGFPSPHDAWLALLEAADVARRWLDLNKDHDMFGTSVEYSAVLALDDELSAILTRRMWTDKDADLTFGQPQVAASEEIKRLRRQASLIRSTVYYRTLKLHRPFMSLGYRDPERYGASVVRSLVVANALVEEARSISSRGWLSSRDRIQKYYLFQACLALITDLWYRPRALYPAASLSGGSDLFPSTAPGNTAPSGDKNTRQLQENLIFIIDRLKDEGQVTEGSVLHGAGGNLERLLAATVQRASSHQGGPAASGPVTSKDPSHDNAASMLPSAAAGLAPSTSDGDTMVELLDAHLSRLADITPQTSLTHLNASTGFADSVFGGASALPQSDFANFMVSRNSVGDAHDLSQLMSTGPDWDQAWTDLFETLEGDAAELS